MNIFRLIAKEFSNYVAYTIKYNRERYILWLQAKRLREAKKLCDATSIANNKQYHVYKVLNKYHILCRLDFKHNKNLTQKEKDKWDIIKLREAAVYSTPLCLLKRSPEDFRTGKKIIKEKGTK